MGPEEMYVLLRAQPFRPFRIHLSNGRTFDVRHPELAMVGVATVLIGRPAANHELPTFDWYDTVALGHINNIEQLPVPAPASSNGGQ